MRKVLTLLFLFVLGAGIRLFAQGTDLGTIQGTVTDVSDALIPGATVQITDTSTHRAQQLTTNANGNFQASGLRSGTYDVSIAMAGFSTVEIHGLALAGSAVVRADARLKPATASQSVVISSEAPLVHTDDQTISQTLNNTALIELPRDSRDIYTFLYLNPNITQADSDGAFKFIGSQSYGANFTLDGQRSNGGIFGQPTNSQPSLEAIGELNILSNDFSAEYAGVANIRVETKRGGAQYHGSAFYNNKNSALAAWTLQDKIGQSQFLPTYFQSQYPNPFFNITDTGGSLGGPVAGLKNTYFFAAYEKNLSSSPAQIQSSRLPDPSFYTGDFSRLADSAKPSVPAGITLTAQEIAQDTVGGQGQQFIRIPQRLLNPTVQNLIKDYFPVISTAAPVNASNGRLTNYFSELPGTSDRNLGTFRVDHDFNESNRIYGVYNISSQQSATSPVVNPFPGLGLTQNDRMNHTVSTSYTHLFGPRVVNELRGGFNREDLLRHSNQTLGQFLQRVGFNESEVQAYGDVVSSYALTTYGHPAVSFGSGLQAFSNGGRNTYRPTDEHLITVGDTLTWVTGKHSVKVGADVVRNDATDGFANNRGNPRGAMTYRGSGPQAFADFVLGMPPTSISYVNQLRPPMQVYNYEHGYFVQDDFKMTSRLTINLGLRYELILPFVEKNDLLANFDPTYTNPSTGALGRFIIPSSRTLKYLDPRIIAFGYATAGSVGLGRGLVHPDINNFAPRVGFAFRMTDKTVLRGGYGVYYPTSAAQGIRDPIGTNPFNQSLTKTGTAANPISGWPGYGNSTSPVSGGVLNVAQSTPAINAVPTHLAQPTIQQYNVTVERELGWQTAVRLSYLGSKMTGLIAGTDMNEIAPSNNPFGTTIGDGVTACDPINNQDCQLSNADLARERFPGLGDYLLTYGNYGHGRSDAFQAELNHRFGSGLMFSFSYTYLNQRSSALDTGNSSLGGVAYNPFQPNVDYGEDGFVPHNRAVAYGIWNVPVGRGLRFGSTMSKLADTVVGGWQVSSNMFAQTGTGFTPFWVCDDCGPVSLGNIGVSSQDAVGDFNGPSYRPVVVSKNYQQKNGDQIFNPDAFGLPPVGADLFSNSSVAKRNMLQGPGTWGLNLGVHKSFRFGESIRAELGADFNNVLNHPLFSPNADYGGGGGPFAMLGDFNIGVNPKTLQPYITDVNPNPLFGRLEQTFTQQGVDSRRTVRLRLRITF